MSTSEAAISSANARTSRSPRPKVVANRNVWVGAGARTRNQGKVAGTGSSTPRDRATVSSRSTVGGTMT
jgi:hypothetical protein